MSNLQKAMVLQNRSKSVVFHRFKAPPYLIRATYPTAFILPSFRQPSSTLPMRAPGRSYKALASVAQWPIL
jgi:hypothetical protein